MTHEQAHHQVPSKKETAPTGRNFGLGLGIGVLADALAWAFVYLLAEQRASA